jgi:hypothetical protein
MNILDVKGAKVKSYLGYLSRHGATSRKNGIRIEDVESALRMDDKLFDEITRYLLAEGYTQRSAAREIYITKLGLGILNK